MMDNQDWKLNPNVQVRIMLHKLDYKKYNANDRNDFHPRHTHTARECNKNVPNSQNSESETDSEPMKTTINLPQENSETFFGTLQKVVLQCEADCDLCSIFINQLSQHIKAVHCAHSKNNGDDIQRTHSEIKSTQCYGAIGTEIHVPVITWSPCKFDTTASLENQNQNPVKYESESEMFNLKSETAEDLPDTKMFYISNNIKTEANELSNDYGDNIEIIDPLYIRIPDESAGSGPICDTELDIDIASNIEESIFQNPPQKRTQPYFCAQCNLSFSDITILIEHNDRIHKKKNDTYYEPEKRHRCNICKKSYRLIKNLIRHGELKHGSKKTFSTNNPSQQKSQVCESETSQSKPTNDCEIEKSPVNPRVSAETADKLNEHIRKRAVGNKCNVCGKTFKNEFSIKCHMLSHTIEATVSGPVQGPSLTNELPKTNKNIDTQSHSHPLYPCQYCHTRFQSKLGLQTHQREIHTDKIKFSECEKCGECFSSPYKLSQHIKQKHNRIKKPHKCDNCNKSFQTLFGLGQHKWKSHSIYSFHANYKNKSRNN